MLKIFRKTPLTDQDEEIACLKSQNDELVKENSEMKKTIKLKEQEAKNANDSLRADKKRFEFRESLSIFYSGSLEKALNVEIREVETLKRKVEEMNSVIVPALTTLLNKNEEKSDQPFEWLRCERCSKPFNDTETDRTPKVLGACGHTICLVCAMDLEGPHFVSCPNCQKVTRFEENSVMDGLKTNFTVLKISRQTL